MSFSSRSWSRKRCAAAALRLKKRRVDFLCGGGVAVEVKRGKPPHGKLLEQIRRYASQPQVNALILVVERTADLPHTVCGKPCRVVALNRLWGVAVG